MVDELRSFTSHKYILSGMKMYFSFVIFIEWWRGDRKWMRDGKRWEPDSNSGHQHTSTIAQHVRAHLLTTEPCLWHFALFFYRKCILVPVTMSLLTYLWQTAQVMVSLAASVSLGETAPVIKMWKHIVITVLDLQHCTFSADVFFSRWFVSVWFESCTSLTNIHQLKPRIVAISNKVIVLFNCQKHCIWCLVSTIYYRHTKITN